eukprot:1724117-Pyramimonas_sp.AAC.1
MIPSLLALEEELRQHPEADVRNRLEGTRLDADLAHCGDLERAQNLAHLPPAELRQVAPAASARWRLQYFVAM